MVSEPNFILGIKQISLHNKQDSYTRNTNPPQCHCLPIDLDPMASHNSHGTIATILPPCLWSLKHVVTPFLDLCKSSLHLMKSTTQMCSSTSRKQNPEIRWPITTTRATTRYHSFCHKSHASLCWPWYPPIYMWRKTNNHLLKHAPTDF